MKSARTRKAKGESEKGAQKGKVYHLENSPISEGLCFLRSINSAVPRQIVLALPKQQLALDEGWKAAISNAFESIIASNSPECQLPPSILDIVYTPARNDVYSFISEKVKSYVNSVLEALPSAKDPIKLYNSLVSADSVLQSIDSYFYPFISKYSDHPPFSQALAKAMSSAISNPLLDQIIEHAFSAFTSKENSTELKNISTFLQSIRSSTPSFNSDFNALITKHFVFGSAKKSPNQKLSFSERFSEFSQIVGLLRSILPPQSFDAIARSFTSTIEPGTNINEELIPGLFEIDSGLDSFLLISSQIGAFDQSLEKLCKYAEDAASHCADSFEPLLNIIRQTQYQPSIIVGPHVIRSISKAMRRGFNTNKDAISKSLASFIHKKFSTEDLSDSEIYALSGSVQMIGAGSYYVCAHSYLLLKRLISCNPRMFEYDAKFLSSIKEKIGSTSSQIQSIIDDFNESRSFTQDYFVNHKCSVPLSISILPEHRWRYSFSICSVPDEICKALGAFSCAFREKYPKKRLQWVAQLSSAVLKTENFTDITEVECSGYIASILLALSKLGTTDSASLMKAVGCDEAELESNLKVLKSAKCAKIVNANKGEISLNKEAKDEENVLKIPMILPDPTLAEEQWQGFAPSREVQLNSVIVKILKESPMAFSKILDSAQSKVSFTIDPSLLNSQLSFLEKARFVKRDQSQTYQYIP